MGLASGRLLRTLGTALLGRLVTLTARQSWLLLVALLPLRAASLVAIYVSTVRAFSPNNTRSALTLFHIGAAVLKLNFSLSPLDSVSI